MSISAPSHQEPVESTQSRLPAARGESKSIVFVFLELVFTRWMIIGGIFFTAVLWSYLTVFRTPDTFSAKGQVLIKRGALQYVRNVPIMRQQEELGSEVDILLSIRVIEEVVDQLLETAQAGVNRDVGERKLIFDTYAPSRPTTAIQLADLPLTARPQLQKFVRDQIRVQKFGESNVIEIEVVSVNPAFAAELVNTLIDVYEKFNLTVEYTPGQSKIYEDEIRKVDDQIDALQADLAAYKQGNRVVDVLKERELMQLRRHGLQVTLDELQVKKRELEADLEIVDGPKGRVDASFLRNDQTILAIRKAFLEQQNQLAQMRSTQTDDNPLVRAKREEVAALEEQLLREENIAIAQHRHEYRQTLKKEEELLAKIKSVEDELVRYPVYEAEIDRFDRDIKQRTIKRVDMVEQMLKSSTLERSDETLNKVKVLGYAQVPAFPREARRGFKFLVAVVFSLIASFVVGAFVDSLDHSIRRRDEIEDQLGVPHLASLGTHQT
jgi:uncharacterized protein involved in exopolysaccharide biosynthesis